MNKFEKLVSEAEVALVIAGLPAFNRFELLSLDNTGDDAAVIAAKHGLTFCGVITLNRQFQPRVAFAVELTVEQQKFVADLFGSLMERAVTRVENPSWLNRLHGLPDPRAN
jgi:hypothetical protein